MKFRQRLAWLFVLMYLGGTFACFYYIFEINDHYNRFAVDHVQKYHTPQLKSQDAGESESQNVGVLGSLWGHVTDLPLPVWMLIFLLPYMQIFLMILACTRAEPKLSVAYMWPGLLYMKYRQCFNREKYGDIVPAQKLSSQYISNGSTVLHT